MKDIFKDVLGIDGVHGLLVISDEGGLTLSKFSQQFQGEEEKLSRIDWASFTIELTGVNDAELLYENVRFYVKKSEAGYLIVILGYEAPISMVRLNCEIMLPSLDRMKSTSKKIGALFRKKIF
jgi:hypothetical protein